MCSEKDHQAWKAKATQAYGNYLNALERDLPPDASIVDIEAAMLEHYQEMMSETFQALADRQGFSPLEGKGDT